MNAMHRVTECNTPTLSPPISLHFSKQSPAQENRSRLDTTPTQLSPHRSGWGPNTKRYSLFGVGFGLAFPVMSLGLDMGFFHPMPFSLANLAAIHLANPLHFIIDSAPIFLGLAFGIAGRFLDRAQDANYALQQSNEDLAQKHEEVLNNTRAMMAQQGLLQSQARQLTEYQERMTSSLNYARRIQRTMLGKGMAQGVD